MRASSTSSFFFAGPLRRGDQVRFDRHHHEPGLNQAFHQQPVAGLQDDPDLVWVGLQGPELFQQGFQGWLAVFHPEHLDDPVARAAEGNHVEGLGPIDPNAEHTASFAGAQVLAGGVAPC